jgi:predicted DCC family thiol-disulfide oxidoreductase YuxK
VLDKDKEKFFLITNLQSKFTEEKFPELRKIDSVAVIKKNGEIVQKSKAVNHILKSINRLILLRIILNILPLSISNLFYDIVAKSRYKVFGKYDSCQLPEPEYKSRFIA